MLPSLVARRTGLAHIAVMSRRRWCGLGRAA